MGPGSWRLEAAGAGAWAAGAGAWAVCSREFVCDCTIPPRGKKHAVADQKRGEDAQRSKRAGIHMLALCVFE